ncbi:DUF5691 domain-containing protein [Nakamurella sp.]|uniref:DUF5691 domain-containing protein n=1 Tax=Nakamurella sp. TaxID=1869182 RepID=UPI003783AE18
MTITDPSTADLVAAATVGTAHRAVDLGDLPGPVRPDPLPADPAVALLDAAALAALARRTAPAARTAPKESTQPAAEHVPVIPDVVRQMLGQFQRQPVLLVEALTLIRQAGLRLPPELVPVLLDDGRPAVVAAARPVTGEIGRLLMTKNPRWAEPSPPDPADRTRWDEGALAERVTWLRALRRADPDAARNVLTDGFARESATTRAELLAVLGDGLSPADQDVLLTAAADRSRAVAERALDLLARLPASPLRRDMRALAGRHLSVRRRLRGPAATVTPIAPAEFAPWPPPSGDPWTALLGRVDPVDWPATFGGDPLPLIAAGADPLRPLTPGFRAAALAFGHAGLARALVSAQLAAASARVPPVVDPELWWILAPADARELLERLLDDRRLRPDQVEAVVSGMPRPWPASLGRLVARWLPSSGPANGPAPRSLWDRWATAAALPDCRELAALARAIAGRATGEAASTLVTRAGHAATLLTVRAVLHETLCPPGGNP